MDWLTWDVVSTGLRVITFFLFSSSLGFLIYKLFILKKELAIYRETPDQAIVRTMMRDGRWEDICGHIINDHLSQSELRRCASHVLGNMSQRERSIFVAEIMQRMTPDELDMFMGSMGLPPVSELRDAAAGGRDWTQPRTDTPPSTSPIEGAVGTRRARRVSSNKNVIRLGRRRLEI